MNATTRQALRRVTRPVTRHVTRMTIEDAEHYTPEQRAAIVASYPAHEREARTKGVPLLGSGRVFPLDEALIKVAPFAIAGHWPVLGALDFGWDHPTAAVKLAWDRDADCVYVTHAYRKKEATPLIHAAVAHDKGSGEALKDQYEVHGLAMLPAHATFEDGSNGVEAGLMAMLDRMQTARLRVFAHLEEWFEEFRLYHRKDGLVVKLADDLMSATRYGLMSLRFAQTERDPADDGEGPREPYDPFVW
jgi:hypothetical protein